MVTACGRKGSGTQIITKVTTITIKNGDMASIPGSVEMSIRVATKAMFAMGMGKCIGEMEVTTKEIGSTASNTAKDAFTCLQKVSRRVFLIIM